MEKVCDGVMVGEHRQDWGRLSAHEVPEAQVPFLEPVVEILDALER